MRARQSRPVVILRVVDLAMPARAGYIWVILRLFVGGQAASAGLAGEHFGDADEVARLAGTSRRRLMGLTGSGRGSSWSGRGQGGEYFRGSGGLGEGGFGRMGMARRGRGCRWRIGARPGVMASF